MTLSIKTSDLIGTDLDWAVIKCEKNWTFESELDYWAFEPAPYSTDWSLAGPIIEREQIATWYEKHEDASLGLPCWYAAYYCEAEYKGPTLLIAAMRCYVASKFGNEFELIKELTNES